MTVPRQSGWQGPVLGAAFTLLFAGAAIYIAMRLIEAVLPVLIGVGIVGVLIYVVWLVHRHRDSGW